MKYLINNDCSNDKTASYKLKTDIEQILENTESIYLSNVSGDRKLFKI